MSVNMLFILYFTIQLMSQYKSMANHNIIIENELRYKVDDGKCNT